MTWEEYMHDADRRWDAADTFADVEAGAFEASIARRAAYLERPDTIADVEAMEAACKRLRAQMVSEARDA